MVTVLDKFNPENMPNDSIVCVMGPRSSGKTTLALDLVKESREKLVLHGIDIFDEKLNQLVKEARRQNINQGSIKSMDQTTIVIDDWCNNENFKEIITSSIHLNTQLIFTCQGPFAAHPIIAANTDFLFLSSTRDPTSLKKIHSRYIPCSFDEFQKICNFIFKNPYTFLVVDRINNKFFYHKVDLEQQIESKRRRWWWFW